jgi:hypothetical protein
MTNQTDTTTDPAWVPCVCDEWFCLIHRLHVFECDCPPIEDWAVDPYRCQPMSVLAAPLEQPRGTGPK